METQQFQEVKKHRGEGEPELHCIFPVISNTNLTRRACLLATLVFILFHMCSLRKLALCRVSAALGKARNTLGKEHSSARPSSSRSVHFCAKFAANAAGGIRTQDLSLTCLLLYRCTTLSLLSRFRYLSQYIILKQE